MPEMIPNMRETLAAMWSLLMSVALLMLGVGLFNTFINLRAQIEGFSTASIGLLTSAFYLGLILGTLQCGKLVNRIGHIRAFAAFSALNAAAIGAFPFVVTLPTWLLLRAFLGFNIAGLYMVAESWLNTKATLQNRGQLLALYMMTSYLALAAGQLLLNLGPAGGLELFMLSSMLLSLALVPVAVTRATSPAPVESERFGFRKLYAISPVAVFGCLGSGLALGALYGMGPIYGQQVGLSLTGIAHFMAVVSVSGLFLQVPIGRLSDRYDRRSIITAVALLCGAASAGLAFWGTFSPALLLSLVAVYGGLVATLYPLSVAYANDYVDAKDMVQASAGLVLAYGIGASIGPTAAAAAMALFGAGGLFVFSSVMNALVAGFALHRRRRRWWVPVVPKEAFVPLPEATTLPTATETDPRAEGVQMALNLAAPPESPQNAGQADEGAGTEPAPGSRRQERAPSETER